MNIRPQTRDAIIEAAFQLFKANPKASLGDIAQHAGVGRATLHRYFPSRDELVIELAKIALQELDDAADQAADQAESYTDAIKLILQALVPLADRQWFLANSAVDANPEIQEAYHRQAKEMADVVEQAKLEGGVGQEWPAAWVVEVLDALLFAAWEMVRKEEATEKQAAELAWNTFVNGLGGN